MHDRAAGEVDRLDLGGRVPDAVHHAVGAPHHVGQREVDDEHPQHDEGHDGRVLHALGDRADDQGRRDDREHQLVHREHVLRHPVRRSRRSARSRRPCKNANCRAPEDAAERAALAEHEAVADQPPQDGDDAGAAEALRHDRQDVLATHEAAVEQRQARQRHEEHQRGRGHHPGVVAGTRRRRQRRRLRLAVGDVRLDVGETRGELGVRQRGNSGGGRWQLRGRPVQRPQERQPAVRQQTRAAS